MSIIISAIKIIFLIGFLVFIHEGGHFLVAKACKVVVQEFSIGFGPKIWKKETKETKYSLGIIPFGGYVQMLGESEKSDEEGSFSKAKISQRAAIVLAGPLVNIVFGLIVYFILAVVSGLNLSTYVDNIIDVAKENIGTQIIIGDEILEINGQKTRIKSDITRIMSENKGEEVNVKLKRNNEIINVVVKPTEYAEGYYILGIQVALRNATLGQRLYYSFWDTTGYLFDVGDTLARLVTGRVSVNQMSGPIGISSMVAESKGIYDFVYLLSIISVSLGVTNLLPIPALDGGRILLLIIEKIRGKALEEKVEYEIQYISFMLLILFAVYVSYNDILKVFYG